MKKVFIAFMSLTLVATINSCKKDDNTTDEPVFGTVTDIDGNAYQTVKIGTQTWMMENLKTTRYNDGIAIQSPNVNNTQWMQLATGAYCYCDNDTSNNATYGKWYNWYAVNSGKLAPTGWHVPSQAEWQILIDFLGGSSEAGGKMKSTSTLWDSPNTGADNSSHFSALPSGGRYSGFDCGYVGKYAPFWTSTENTGSSNAAFSVLINNQNKNANYSLSNSKVYGFAVRCVKD